MRDPRKVLDKLTGRVKREYDRRGTPLTHEQSQRKAAEALARNDAERRDGVTSPGLRAPSLNLPEGMVVGTPRRK